MQNQDHFIIGTNYWPKETGMYWWRSFDAANLKRDFSLLAEYRMDVARIFLLWEDFQPDLATVSVRSLDHLVQVAERAHEKRIRILPTFFCGHMSGLNWVPDWMVEPGKNKGGFYVCSQARILTNRIRNMFTDKEVGRAQKRLLHETTSALQGHPAVWGWDLGNQVTYFAVPPSRDQTRAWFEEMVNELRRWDAHLPVTIGLHHGDLETPWVLGPNDAAKYCDFLSLQGLPPYPPWAGGPADAKFPAFLCLITKWLTGKDAIIGSLGLPTQPPAGTLTESDRDKVAPRPLFSEGEAEDYFHQALTLLSRNGVSGALAWIFADFDSTLWEKPPFGDMPEERFYGLFRRDLSPKKTAEILSSFPRQRKQTGPDYPWIDMDGKEFYGNPRENLKRLYGKFRDFCGD